MALGPAQGRACDKAKVFWKGPTSTKINFLLKNVVLRQFCLISGLLDLKNGSGSKFRSFWWYQEVCTTKMSPFHQKSMVQRVGGWRARRNWAQTKNKTPKQNGFKPGRWVGLDPFAPGHNKTIKKRSLTVVWMTYMGWHWRKTLHLLLA